MNKLPGNWNPVESDILSKTYDGVTLQVWLALLIINPNKAGVFPLFNYNLQGAASRLKGKRIKNKDIEDALDHLEECGRIRRYPGDVVWIVDRWNYVSNRNNTNTIKNAESFVAPYPTVWEQFKKHYGIQCNDSVDNIVMDTVMDTVANKEKEEEKEEGKEKESKSSDKSKLIPYIPFVKNLFPDITDIQAEKQAETIEKIVRIDKMNYQSLQKILQWARRDDFWSANFLSCAGLRKRKDGPGDRMKWEKIKAAYMKATGIKSVDPFQGWKCQECGLFGQGKFPGQCPNCGSGIYNSGTLPKDWKEQNKNRDRKRSNNPVTPVKMRESLDKLTDKMKRGMNDET